MANDESWVYGYDPEKKPQKSFQWKFSSEPWPQKNTMNMLLEVR